jgi:hypothetical protein
MLVEVPPLGEAACPCKTSEVFTVTIVTKVRLHVMELRGGFPAVSSPHPQHHDPSVMVIMQIFSIR